MMRIIIIITLVVAALASASVNFRSDYEYDRKTDAFFKLYRAPMRYQWAHAFCASEDAQLMPPEDLEQAQKMLTRFPEIGNQVWVGRAAQAIPNIDLQNVEYKQNGVFTSAPAQPADCDVLTVPAGGVGAVPCGEQRPFICKVKAKDAPFDQQCRVFAKGYTYIPEVGSCYKISNVPYTWNQASDACEAQGARLLVLNSELERAVVRNLTLAAPRVFKKKPRHWFVGIRAEKPVGGSPAVFKTIDGQTLSEAGFERWTPLDDDGVEGRSWRRGTRPTRHECGALSREDGCYEDINCEHLQPSICEYKVDN